MDKIQQAQDINKYLYQTEQGCPANEITRFLTLNGKDPDVVCFFLYVWSHRLTGKRGCLVFYGPTSNGKTIAFSKWALFVSTPNKRI